MVVTVLLWHWALWACLPHTAEPSQPCFQPCFPCRPAGSKNQPWQSSLTHSEEPRQKCNKQCFELHFGHLKMLWAQFHKAFAFVMEKKNTSLSFQSQVSRVLYVVNFSRRNYKLYTDSLFLQHFIGTFPHTSNLSCLENVTSHKGFS